MPFRHRILKSEKEIILLNEEKSENLELWATLQH